MERSVAAAAARLVSETSQFGQHSHWAAIDHPLGSSDEQRNSIFAATCLARRARDLRADRLREFGKSRPGGHAATTTASQKLDSAAKREQHSPHEQALADKEAELARAQRSQNLRAAGVVAQPREQPVVNVFDEMMNNDSAGSRPRVASTKSAPSTFETNFSVNAGSL
jgi:hypothetical protein